MERKLAHPGGRKCLTFKTVAFSLGGLVLGTGLWAGEGLEDIVTRRSYCSVGSK